MAKRASRKKQTNPQLQAVLFSFLIAASTILLIAGLGGALILNGVLPETSSNIIACAAVFTASLLGPIPIILTCGRRRAPIAYAVMASILIILLFCKALFWPEAPLGNWWIVPSAALGATASAWLLSRQPRRKH